MTRPHYRLHTRLIPLVLAWGATVAGSAHAQSLVNLYNAAAGYDASYQSAKLQLDASLAKAAQAKALLLPTVGLNVGTLQTNQNTLSPAQIAPAYTYSYGTDNATIAVSQPLYRPANRVAYAQGKKQIDLAQAQLVAAEQDLIIRVSQAYFDVLAASDNLDVVKSQKTAVAEQLASAKRNFEIGTSTITDSREAQARYDLVIAQELAADNDLRVKSLALDQLVGQHQATPKPLKAPIVLATVQPGDVDQWVQQSEANHPGIHQLQVALEVAQLETQKAQDGHKPTVDLTTNFTAVNYRNGTPTVGGNFDSRVNVSTIGLSLNVPLFAGYSIQNRVKETLALQDKASADLEATKRTVAQGVRTAFYGVQSGQAQVTALQAAEASSQSALEANQLGYQVGVRINIDVLNAQSQLYDTKAKLAKARYDVLVGQLKLRQAAGTLNAGDLQPVDSQLAP